jgi:peptidoglycan/LPS O-acetylase OafA/YrhL
MKYRAELDGLRAIAVISVILAHAKFEFFSGGFIGVDIFFVLSGFFITKIIHDEIKYNSFTLSNFYTRRAKRILPALIFVILFIIDLHKKVFPTPTLPSNVIMSPGVIMLDKK